MWCLIAFYSFALPGCQQGTEAPRFFQHTITHMPATWAEDWRVHANKAWIQGWEELDAENKPTKVVPTHWTHGVLRDWELRVYDNDLLQGMKIPDGTLVIGNPDEVQPKEGDPPGPEVNWAELKVKCEGGTATFISSEGGWGSSNGGFSQ